MTGLLPIANDASENERCSSGEFCLFAFCFIDSSRQNKGNGRKEMEIQSERQLTSTASLHSNIKSYSN
jgi:hypothetical protein